MVITKRASTLILGAVALVGLLFILIVRDARTATVVFLFTTCLESGLFSLMYGLRSRWRSSDAARAVFYIIFSYFLLSAHIIVSYLWRADYAIREDIRQFLYLFMMIAGLNILLTVVRLQSETARDQRELDRDAISTDP